MGVVVDFLSAKSNNGGGNNDRKNKFLLRVCKKLNDDFWKLTVTESGPFEFLETELVMTDCDHKILQPQEGDFLFCRTGAVTVNGELYRLAMDVCDTGTANVTRLDRHRDKKNRGNNLIP